MRLFTFQKCLFFNDGARFLKKVSMSCLLKGISTIELSSKSWVRIRWLASVVRSTSQSNLLLASIIAGFTSSFSAKKSK